MKRFVFVAILAILGSFTPESHGGVLTLAGTTSSPTGVFNALPWSLNIVYNANNVGAAAGIASGLFKIGTTSLVVNTATAGDTATVSIDSGVNDDRLVIAFDFSSSGTIFGGAVSGLTVEGKADVSSAIASDANIQLLAAMGNTVTGPNSVTLFDSGLGVVTITLNGSVPVPEPSSVGLVACLGLVVARRIVKRRSSKSVN